ncbi:MAG: ribonuclease P protein component [Clostridia bacterium]|jgi:ribonuclease P protein component|nr:ribonuclease P protein component [Clostridia bacterium]
MKRCYSLKRNKEFRRVYKAGKSVACRTMVLIYLKGPAEGVKIGFAVGKRIGGAVVRNKVKRRLREAVTPLLPEMVPGCRLIFVARSPIAEVTYRDMENNVRRLLDKAGLIG